MSGLGPRARSSDRPAATHRDANMVRKWVVRYQQGGYSEFRESGKAMLPVIAKPQRIVRRARSKADAPATIEVELRRGVLRLHGVDVALLSCVRTHTRRKKVMEPRTPRAASASSSSALAAAR
jgi:hypothetical protein